MVLPALSPACQNGLPGNGGAFRGRECGRPCLPALGCPELGQGDGGRIASIGWRWRLRRGLSGRFLHDLIGQGVHVAGALFTCAGRHGPIVAQAKRLRPNQENE